MALSTKGIICMAEKLDPNELVNFKELLMANSIQVDAMSSVVY